jgi:CRISPR-associated protein Cas5h
MTPLTDTVPPRCLSFTVRSDWGHFRRIDGTIVKQTYGVPPRTTVAGLCAAIVGAPRDSYYDVFQPTNSAIAVTPLMPYRTTNLTINSLSTDEAALKTSGSHHRLKLQTVDASKPRQQHNYEYIVDPAYRINIWVDDDTFYNDLRTHLENGTSTYTPSMGLSELLATVDYHGEYTPTESASDTVDSALPTTVASLVPAEGVSYMTEHSPAIMSAETVGGQLQRTTDAFVDWAFTPDPDDQLQTTGAVADVDEHTAVFV